MSQLLPEGITHLGDCPFTLHHAIVTGLRILDYEEFPIEERPPKRIWLDGDELNAWWKKVNAERKRKYGVRGGGDVDDDVEHFEENAVKLVDSG